MAIRRAISLDGKLEFEPEPPRNTAINQPPKPVGLDLEMPTFAEVIWSHECGITPFDARHLKAACDPVYLSITDGKHVCARWRRLYGSAPSYGEMERAVDHWLRAGRPTSR